MRRRALLASLLAVAGTFACADREVPQWPEERLVVALESPPTSVDPRIGVDQSSERLYELFLDGLVRLDPRGEVLPALAESWEVLDDGRRYRFRLAADRRFHDGRPLTAADVAWTYNSMLDGTVATAKSGAFDSLARVEAVDELTVDFVLTEPWGALLVNLTTVVGIIPEGTTPEEMRHRPVGTGPFRIVDRAPDRIELAAWDEAAGGAPPLDRVVLRAIPDATVRALELENGSVQLVVNGLAPDVVPLFADRPGYEVEISPGANYAYLGLNLDDPLLDDVRVRRAIAAAIDRQRLVAALWHDQAEVTETLVPPGHWARHDGLEPIRFDPARARRLLDAAGRPDPDGDGPKPRMTLTYKTSTDETARLQAQVIQEMLGEVGIEVEVRSFEFATFFADVKRGAFQLYSLVWTGISDPDIYRYILHSDSVPPAGANRNRYRNPRFDALVDRAARLFEPADRRPLYLRAQELIHRDLPYISLYTKKTVAVKAAPLAGYVNYPSGQLYSLRHARWQHRDRDAGATSSPAGQRRR